ncbi:MAG: glycosyltransferase family 2 protein, partial [Bacteroidia bacterium]|nr:glycosyltransferase family 2 protein [Bacteroidia bacterium]
MKGIVLENSEWIGWLWVFHSIGLTVFSLIVLVNLFWVQSIGMCKNPLFFPLVSVLIPARNEEKNIGKLLTCLEQQDYPNFEVIVLDDHSTDGTESVVLPFLSRNRRWRMLSGRPLPPEWRGKPFACYQLGLEASGEILLFIDADTLPKSNALTATVCALEKYDFISVFPEQVVKTWSEKLIVPVMDFFLYSHLMFPLITKTSNPAFTAANGQWMAFKRLAYEAINGHLAAKSAI